MARFKSLAARAGVALVYLRAHKVQATTLAIAAMSAVSHFVPDFPAERVMDGLRLLLGA